MTRAMSAVADVTVFLLLVGAAAAAILSGVSPDQTATATGATSNPAAEQATMLATSTASVEYALVVPEPDRGRPPDYEGVHQRTAHGPVAELLGEAAMSGVTVDERRLSSADSEFESAVGSTTLDRIHAPGYRTSVQATWVPYPGAPVKGSFRVGDRPPRTTDVRTATVTVPSGMANVSGEARSAARTRGYDGVATVVAKSVVDGLFPPDQARYALRGDYPAKQLMTQRYQRMGALTGADIDVAQQSTRELNQKLTTTLADRFRDDMQSRYDSPEAAARAVQTSEIRVTVRLWSP